MADSYVSVTWVANELVTSTKLNQAMTNDSGFHDGTALGDGIIVTRHLGAANVTSDKLSLTTYESVLGSTFTTGSTSGTFYDTGVKVTLAAAGTYLVITTQRLTTSAVNNYGYFRLFNQTTSAAIASSTSIGHFLPNAMDSTTPIVKIVTTATTNNILRLECAPGGAYTVNVTTDVAGGTRMIAIRIG